MHTINCYLNAFVLNYLYFILYLICQDLYGENMNLHFEFHFYFALNNILFFIHTV